MSGRDRGQAAVLVMVVAAVLFVAMSAALVDVGGRLIDRARAQTAADAAALGAVSGGREAAETLARRHGATLVSFGRGPDAGLVTVVVRLGTATADAAASDAP
jgi:Flp pilus assembly protein TadG